MQGLVAGGLVTFGAVLVGGAVEVQLPKMGPNLRLPSWVIGNSVPVVAATVALRPSFGLLRFAALLALAKMMRPTSIAPSGRVLVAAAYVAAAIVVVTDERLVLPAGALVVAVLAAGIVSWAPFFDTRVVDAHLVVAKGRLRRLRGQATRLVSASSQRLCQLVDQTVLTMGRVGNALRLWLEGRRGIVLPVALAGVAVIGAGIALRDLRVVLYDDAAITFRYAERIAGGDGFTYNVGDRTNGASAPLYTLFLALFRLAGADLEVAAKAIGIACYSSALAGVGWLAGRARGALAGGLAVVLLILSSDFRAQTLSGMESGFAVVLGLAAVLLWSYRYDLAAGVMLGLVVLNKLDGLALVLALCMVALLIERRIPVRMLAVAGATFAPWLVFSQIYFGSVLPFSFSQKLGGTVGDPASGYSAWWMLRGFVRMGDIALVGLGAASTIWLSWITRNERTERKDTAVIACGLWGLVHAGAYSVLDLGDPYPWYATVAYAALAVPSGAGIMLAILTARRRVVERGSGWTLYLGVAVLLPAILAPTVARNGVALLQTLRDGHQIDEFEAFEATRRDAGQFLADAAFDGEVVKTCFGWPAYGALQSPVDEVCPLSTRLAVDEPTWIVVTSWPGLDDLEVPVGFELKASFVSHIGAGGGSLVVRSMSE